MDSHKCQYTNTNFSAQISYVISSMLLCFNKTVSKHLNLITVSITYPLDYNYAVSDA